MERTRNMEILIVGHSSIITMAVFDTITAIAYVLLTEQIQVQLSA